MKKPLAISLEFDIKTVKKALVLMDHDVPSDEEIEKLFFNADPIKLDAEKVFGEGHLQICLAFMALIMAENENSQK